MYSVLIADDEKIIRKGLCSLIDWESLGYEIIGEAANGREVLTFIEKQSPDVVMIDIRMPNLHGLEAIKRARESGYQGQFIILSGYSDFSYAQDAIRYGVRSYLTKPVDEEELTQVLAKIREELDEIRGKDSSNQIYQEKAKISILQDYLAGIIPYDSIQPQDLGLSEDSYQVILYEKYSYNLTDISYDFSDLLRVSSHSQEFYEYLTIQNQHVILLKGSHAIIRFHEILSKYDEELPPQKNSPLDTIFISCGRMVNDVTELPLSYEDACMLLSKRFFCDPYQHVITYDNLYSFTKEGGGANQENNILLDFYVKSLLDHIQAYNRNKIAETLHELEQVLYSAPLEVQEQKNLLVDLYLQIKEKISYLYRSSNIPFIPNSTAINTILQSYYLYEIIAFLSEQFEMIMSSIGYSSRESIINDIVYYIEHNYAENITLENIAPLFGYNSSYLGKIFSKKIGINFNTYLDNIRIEHSKELLEKQKLQVYKIAELVGYRNVDYFHIKFKKSTGISPAEYRKQHQTES